jgi:hypothetical protein
MSAVPELKQKKIARDALLAKEAAAAATKAAADEAEMTKAIYAKAQAYEAEYENVSVFPFSDRFFFCCFLICLFFPSFIHSFPRLPLTIEERPRPRARFLLPLRRSSSSLSV